jgi:hypothetical protein
VSAALNDFCSLAKHVLARVTFSGAFTLMSFAFTLMSFKEPFSKDVIPIHLIARVIYVKYLLFFVFNERSRFLLSAVDPIFSLANCLRHLRDDAKNGVEQRVFGRIAKPTARQVDFSEQQQVNGQHQQH